jgi:hypothetical protein
MVQVVGSEFCADTGKLAVFNRSTGENRVGTGETGSHMTADTTKLFKHLA